MFVQPQHVSGVLVSIIIPVYKKVEYTKECIKTIIQTVDLPYEIVIIDNAFTDATKEIISSFPNVRLIGNKGNKGFAEACNQGARIARGQYLVFLENDTIPQKGWLRELVSTAEHDLKIGAAGSKLISPNGKLQEAGGIIWDDGTYWKYGREDNPFKPQYNYVREVDFCSGSCLLIRKNLFECIGGFDIQFAPASYEDIDLCFSVRKMGYKVIFNPKTEIIHEEITAGTDQGTKQDERINHKRFVDKWQSVLSQQALPPTQSRHVNQHIVSAGTRNKGKNILVVDQLMPWYDKASGSLRIFNILKLLRQQDHSITFIARNGINQEHYIDELERLGIEVYAISSANMKASGFGPGKIDLHYILASKIYDIAWLSFYDIAELFLPFIRKLSPDTKVIIDTVDIHYLRETRQAELSADSILLQKAQETKKREKHIYAQADLILTVTEDDKRSLQQEDIRIPIVIIPNVHDALIETKTFGERSGILFVGNFNHTPNLDATDSFVADIWPLVKRELPGVKFYIVGNRSKELCRYGDTDIITTGFVPDTQPYLQQCRVSIAPLRYGAGMKGKIGEAMMSGIPVVTSSIGAEGMDLKDGEHVLVTDDPGRFAASIARLYTQETLWRQLVNNSKMHVNAFYGRQVIARKLQSLLEL